MKFLKISLFLLLFPLLTASSTHKFYVSITKIEYVEEKQTLQIISKIFIDDIEDVLQQRYDTTISLATKKETKKDVDFLKKYVSQKLQIAVNESPVKITYIGREYETDIVKIYMEVINVTELRSIEISNKILMELFEEQQNIIHVKIDGNRRSLVLEKENPKGMLNFN